MKFKVSIVIATFNACKTITQALESVQQQSFKDWECLVVDGASKDDTVSIVETFCRKDHRFRYISEPDKGIYDAFNKGWQTAKGEWILYLGADDFLFPNGLAELMKHAGEADVIYGDCELRFERTKRIRGNLPLSCIRHRLPACHQSFVMRRSVIEKLGGFNLEYKVYGDFDLIQRAYMAGFKFKETKAVISSFSVGGVSSDNISAEAERYRVMKNNKSTNVPALVVARNICMKAAMKIWHHFK